ncbi:PadR family transcriptional regulator [Nocardiopsis xinjiangensis]|uniref:PadR family transcriptional regulator n=1 Tax=Nocardiopsis xinjiangensis TaxID=124285 RepID=UPI000346E843|nr:PadR family transcriptional regulator [Nocardiopsis xinjiangensis]
MSTIFGHGRLRLYLLKMLDESPRHGYEIISLLRDRFLGVYSPSPGTIYPRLARLEEEGLVTHTEEGGRKVYRLTDKGREELRKRESDLAELEQEITDSVRDVARAVKQDVRSTISSLREELKFSQARREGGPADGPESPDPASERDEGSGSQGPEGSGQAGSSLAEEWGRFARSFTNLGASWRGGTREHEETEKTGEHEERSSDGERADECRNVFDRELRDFSDRVRDVAREAGHIGGAAAGDLRRILDETVEVIRRDMRTWGPPREGPADESGTGEPRPDDGGERSGPEAGSRSTDEGSGGGGAASGDPWSAVADEDGESTKRD